MSLCPECESTLETPLVCVECESLVPQDEDPTPFAALGLAPSWEVDSKDLKRRLLRFSRHLHPDFFATAGETTRELAERGSAVLNAAYETLSDPFRRADWLVVDLGGPSDSDERQMKREFLVQVLEWNETLEDARSSPPGSPERRALTDFSSSLRVERNQRLEAVGEVLTPLPERGSPTLREARRELNAVRYIDRVLTDLEALRLESLSLRGGAAS